MQAGAHQRELRDARRIDRTSLSGARTPFLNGVVAKSIFDHGAKEFRSRAIARTCPHRRRRCDKAQLGLEFGGVEALRV